MNAMDDEVEGRHRLRTDWQLVCVTAVNVALYLASNLMAVKLLCVWGITWFDCGTLLFPLVYMLGDVLTEIWGFRVARKVILLTFVCNVIMIMGTAIPVWLPSPDYQAETAAAYSLIYSYAPRIVLASLAAFLAGGLANAWSMEKIRGWTGRRLLWVRTIGSSVYGYLFDTALFVLLAFGGTSPWRDIASMLWVQFVVKMAIEICLATPTAYLTIYLLQARHKTT